MGAAVLANSGTLLRPARRLAGLGAEALAQDGAVVPALAGGETLRLAHVLAVALPHAGAHELVALRHAVARLRHPRRPHLCTSRVFIRLSCHQKTNNNEEDERGECVRAPEATRRSRKKKRTGAAARREVIDAISLPALLRPSHGFRTDASSVATRNCKQTGLHGAERDGARQGFFIGIPRTPVQSARPFCAIEKGFEPRRFCFCLSRSGAATHAILDPVGFSKCNMDDGASASFGLWSFASYSCRATPSDPTGRHR
jgi:hypothetical protein